VLALAACASSANPADPNDPNDPGDPTTDPVPERCDDAPCPAGFACAIDTHQCVRSPIVLDGTLFYDDGARWLARTSGPRLDGEVLEPSTTAVTVLVDGRVTGHAVLAGGRWSFLLPAGTLTPADARVTLRAATPGGTVDLVQTLALDASVPTVEIRSGTRDERGDVIDFQTGAPVHQHAGMPIVAHEDCADLYKYAYLMDPQPPAFGAETSPNPLAWVFHADGLGIDPARAQYRIRRQTGETSTIVRDWTTFDPPVEDEYMLPLFRSGPAGIPALGTTAQQLHVDVVFHDWKGLEVASSVCWNHRPMAAPVEVRRPAAAAVGTTLLSMSLAADSPISRLMTFGQDVPVFQARVRHFAAEPVTLRLTPRAPQGSYTKHAVEDFVAPVLETVSIDCDQEVCNLDAPLDLPDEVSSGSLGGARWRGQLVDALTLQPVPCNAVGCPLPPRTGPQPREYLYIASLGHAGALLPGPGTIGEFTLAGLTFTGIDPVETEPFAQCVQTRVLGDLTQCIRQRRWHRLIALDRIQLQIQPIAIDVATPLDASRIDEPAAYLPDGAVTAEAPVAWDSGDDDLPGPH
jgi:hypothetical protein